MSRGKNGNNLPQLVYSLSETSIQRGYGRA